MKTFSLPSAICNICDRSGLPSILLFLAALLIRLSALGRYITPDELIWVYRSVLFREALSAGLWGDTLVAGHPGVITTWLGSGAISLQLLLNAADLEAYKWITQLAWLTPDNMVAFQKLSVFLSAGRFMVAAISSLGIVAVFILSRRLFNSCLALLLAMLLAIDPFFAGLSGLLHVDGLVTTFVMLSLLTLALAAGFGAKEVEMRSQLVYAAISGATASLAALSKSPALLLLPVAALVFLLLLILDRDRPLLDRLQVTIVLGVIWIVSFFLLTILLFPALWTSPERVLQLSSGNASRHVVEALRPTFFLGRIAFDHGPIFYPLAVAFRIGPVVTVGLVILAVLLFTREKRSQIPLRTVFIFGLWALLFLGLITITAKKFDRYALPIFPALTVLAVIGWGYWLQTGKRLGWILLSFLIVTQVSYMLFVLPYPLSAYNMLLGGPITAGHVLPMGWGESISSAGAWLAAEVDGEQLSAVSGIAPSLAPFFPGTTLLAEENEEYAKADFIIFTAGSRQNDPLGVKESTAELDLLHIIHYGGLDQAWIYANPNPTKKDLQVSDLPFPITFDEKINLVGQDLRVDNGEIKFTARWEQLVTSGRYLVKLRILDENGIGWGRQETALLNEVYFYPENWLPNETPVITYDLDLAASAPPGKYTVTLSLIEESSGAQLPVGVQGEFSGVVYEVGVVNWDEPGLTSTAGLPEFVPVENSAWLEDSLHLLGYSIQPDPVVAGADLTVDLFWRAGDQLPQGLQVALQVGDETPIQHPLSRFDSAQWQPERIIQEKYRLPVPADMSAGAAMVRLQPKLSDGQSVGEMVELTNVSVMTTDRVFTLPDQIPLPVAVRFEPGITLRGAGPVSLSAAIGDHVSLTLYWQAEGKTEEPVTAFVHLVDENGTIVTQIDRWPAGLPSNIWAPGQVIIDEYELPIPSTVKPGVYRIVVGLYNANDGLRFAVRDEDGQQTTDDSVFLPLTVEIES